MVPRLRFRAILLPESRASWQVCQGRTPCEHATVMRRKEHEQQPASSARRGVPRQRDSPEPTEPSTLLEHLQATAGNRAVQRLLAPPAEATVVQREAAAPTEPAAAKPQNEAFLNLYERAVVGNINLAMEYLDPKLKPKKADFNRARDFLYHAVANNHALVMAYEKTDPLLFERLSSVTERLKFIAWEIGPHIGKDEPTEVDILHGWTRDILAKSQGLTSQLR